MTRHRKFSKSVARLRQQRKRRDHRPLRAELLEDRRLLAAGTNTIYLDFTPDAIEDEWQPKPFLDTFTTEGRRGDFYPLNSKFLDYDNDGDIDVDDGFLAAKAITRSVRARMRPFLDADNIDVRVLSTAKAADKNSNAGKKFLDSKIEREDENAFVIYIGGDLKTINPDFASVGGGRTDFSGVAIQGDHEGNHEWYAYALSERTAHVMAEEHFEKERLHHGRQRVLLDATKTSDGQPLLTRLLDDPNPPEGVTPNLTPRVEIRSGNANYEDAGVTPGDLVSVNSNTVFRVKEVVNGTVLRLHELDVFDRVGRASTLENWVQDDTPVTLHRMKPPTSKEYTDRVSWAIVHELGHLLGLGHVCKTVDGDCIKKEGATPNPTGGKNLMNYSTNPATNKFLKIPAKYDTELHDIGILLDTEFWEPGVRHFQEVYRSFRFDSTEGEFWQPSDSDIKGDTYLEIFEEAVFRAQFFDESAEQVDFALPPPERTTLPAPTQGTVGSTTPSDVTSLLVAGFDGLRQNQIEQLGSKFNLGTGALPVMDANFGELFGLADAIGDSLETLELTSVTMTELNDQLTAAGFTVDRFIEDTAFAALPTAQPADFIQVSRQYRLDDSFRESTFTGDAAAALGDLGSIGLSGEMEIDGQTMFSVTFGVDSQGFYLVPGEVVRFQADASSTLDVGLATAASVAGSADASVFAQLDLVASHADGRIRLADLESNFEAHSTLDYGGGATVGVDAEYELPGGVSIPLAGSWMWDVDATGFTLDADMSGFDAGLVEDELVELVGAGLNELAQLTGAMSNGARSIPLIGGKIADELSPLLTDSLAYANEGGSGRAFLEDRGFELISAVTPAQLIDGSFLSADLIRLGFNHIVTYDIDPITASGNFDVPGGDLSLSGGLEIDPEVSFDMQFGVDAVEGAYVVEGSRIDADLSTAGSLTAGLEIAGFTGVTATANATFATGSAFVLSDFDSTPQEKFYLSDFISGDLIVGQSPESIQGTGDVTIDLDLSVNANGVPTIGEFLTGALSWSATATFDLGSREWDFEIDQSSLPSLGNIEAQVRDKFLSVLDENNPLPQQFRDFLSINIDFLGNKSLFEMLGMKNAEILLNPMALDGMSEADVNVSDDQGHITLNYAFADPANLTKLLMGQPADLITLDIDRTFLDAGIEFPVVPETPLATFYGIVSATFEANATVGLELGVDMVVGLDSTGFYLEADDEPFLTVTGSIGGNPVLNGKIGDLDFARVKGTVDLSATGGLTLTSPSSEPVRVRELYGDDNQLDEAKLLFDLAFDLGWSLKGELGVGSQTASTQTYGGSRRLFHLKSGGGEPGGSDFEELKSELEKEAQQLGWCSAAVAAPNIITVAGCAYHSRDDIVEWVKDVGEWGRDRWNELEDFAAEVLAGVATAARNAVGEFEGFLERIGLEELTIVTDLLGGFVDFGSGSTAWEALEIPQRAPTFNHELADDGTLYVTWLEGHRPGRGWREEGGSWTTRLPIGYVGTNEPYQNDNDRPQITVHANGSFEFGGTTYHVLESDFRLDGIGDDIFIEQPSDSQVPIDVPVAGGLFTYTFDVPEYTTIRWDGTNKRDDQDINFAARIYYDGRVQYDYGPGTRNVTPKIGKTTGDVFEPLGIYNGVDDLVGEESIVYSPSSELPLLRSVNQFEVLQRFAAGPFPENGVPSVNTIDQALPSAANLVFATEGFGVGRDIIIDAPDFITSEAVAKRGVDCRDFDGCQDEFRYEAIRHPNRLRIDYDDVTRIVVTGSTQNDRIAATSEFDLPLEVSGLAGNDLLVGGGGNDTLIGGEGDDTVSGSEGNDELSGGIGEDLLLGGWGNDTINGGPGDDRLDETEPRLGPLSPRSTEMNWLYGEEGDDALHGSPGMDVLDGGIGSDNLFGNHGADTLRGGPESGSAAMALLDRDLLRGGFGPDELWGGIGVDLLVGNSGNDTLYGGDGDDELRGDDTFFGSGDDELHGQSGSDVLSGGLGDDDLFGGSEADVLRGGEGDDLLVGAEKEDRNAAGDGNDALFGGSGDDELDGGPSGPGLPVFARGDALEFDVLEGQDGNDLLIGGPGPDDLDGGSGIDELRGGEGDDWLNGGSGRFFGEAPDFVDVLLGGPGSDELFGTSNFAGTIGSKLDGGPDADKIGGSPGPDLLIGGEGGDSLDGLEGDDRLEGSAGDDQLFGSEGNDELLGGPGADELRDGPGNDDVTVDSQDTHFAQDTGGDRFTTPDLSFSTTFVRHDFHYDQLNGFASDRFEVSGGVLLAGEELQVNDAVSPDFGRRLPDSVLLIDNDGSDPISGAFAGLAEGAIVIQSFPASWTELQVAPPTVLTTISYAGGDGNDVEVITHPFVVESVEFGVDEVEITFSDEVDETTVNDRNFEIFGTQSGVINDAQREIEVDHNRVIVPIRRTFVGESITLTLFSDPHRFDRTGVWSIHQNPLFDKQRFERRVTGDGGTGQFVPVAFIEASDNVLNGLQGIAVADIDRDEDLDFAFDADAYVNGGNGTEWTVVSADRGGVHGYDDLDAVDLDGDGALEFVRTLDQKQREIADFDLDGELETFSIEWTGFSVPAIEGFDYDGPTLEALISCWEVPGDNHCVGVKQDAEQGDFDGDGDVDVVFVGESTQLGGVLISSSRVWMNPTINPPEDGIALRYLDRQALRMTNVEVGDLNGDGLDDIAALGNRQGGNFNTELLIWLSNGGTLDNWELSVIPLPASTLTLGDFDNDGDLDLAAGTTARELVTFRNDGEGQFQHWDTYGGIRGPGGLAAGDFNKDGVVDLVYNGHVLLNRLEAIENQIRGTAATGDEFGAGIAAVADLAVVNNRGSGTVAVQRRDDDGVWREVSELGPGATNIAFGGSLSVDESRILVGARDSNSAAGNAAGTAYLYELVDGAWTLGNQGEVLGGRAGLSGFGSAVGIQADSAVVGAFRESGPFTRNGAAYAFSRSAEGAWEETQRITAGDVVGDDGFGSTLVLKEDLLLIGSPRDDVGSPNDNFRGRNQFFDGGSVYVFERDDTGQWIEAAKLTADVPTQWDRFGSALALDGTTAVVGSENGTEVYVFDRAPEGEWIRSAVLSSDDVLAEDGFGRSVAIQGGVILVGSQLDDDRGEDSGSVYVFRREETGGWVLQEKIVQPDGEAGDQFGVVALVSGTALVGAPLADERGFDSGTLFEFQVGEVEVPQLTVQTVEPNRSGFIAEFNAPIDPSVLNLYDAASADLGPADVVVEGAATGPVRGSLIVDASATSVHFLSTGDPLPPDTYTVTFRGTVNGFRDLDGGGLAGEGGVITSTFTVPEPAPNTVVVGIPDFIRGPRQAVDFPALDHPGLPISISDGTGARTVSLQIDYDATLLSVTGASVAAGMPAGSTVQIAGTAGQAMIAFTSPTDLPAGPNPFVQLQANVLSDAAYGVNSILDVHSVTVTDGGGVARPTIDDDALFVSAYFGDASGNGTINSTDASRVARVAALLDTGLSRFPLTDPLALADISGGGSVNGFDASLIARFVALFSVPQIPPLPGAARPQPASGAPANLDLGAEQTPSEKVRLGPSSLENGDDFWQTLVPTPTPEQVSAIGDRSGGGLLGSSGSVEQTDAIDELFATLDSGLTDEKPDDEGLSKR